MANKRKSEKKGFNPNKLDLKRVLRYAITKLKSGEIEEVKNRAHKVAKKHYRKDRRGDPSTWIFYTGKEWLTYGLKEILNIRAGQPINDYRVGGLTLSNLRELAGLVGIEKSQLGEINRSVWWSQIAAKVKQDEDSLMNRLKKLWSWFEAGIDVTDVDYLMVHAPGFWQDRECYLDPEWKLRHLSDIFTISYMIREVADAKLKNEEKTPIVSGLSKPQLWVITHKIMNLEVPHSATKEVMWQNILTKIERDKLAQ